MLHIQPTLKWQRLNASLFLSHAKSPVVMGAPPGQLFSIQWLSNSFDLVSPSFQYGQSKSLQRNHSLPAVLQPRSVCRHCPSEPLARSTHVVKSHCEIAGVSSFPCARKEGRPEYWCVLIMPTARVQDEMQHSLN